MCPSEPVAESIAIEEPAVEKVQAQVYDTRKIIANGITQSFYFLVIDKPEKWERADSFHHVCTLRPPGSSIVLEIPVRGLSYMEWEEIEMAHPMPEFNNEVEQLVSKERQAEMERLKSDVVAKRRVKVFEVSTGKVIPGKDLEEKTEWLKRLGTGNADALFAEILDKHSNTANGKGPSSLDNYQQAFETSDTPLLTVSKFESFLDLMSLNTAQMFFRMQRQFDNFIIEFPLKHLSDSKREEIDNQVKEPIPDSKPGKNPMTGKPDQNYPIYAWNDPRYRESMRLYIRARTTMLFEAILPFTIPGDSRDDRYKWIGSHLMGDVVRMKDFIEEDVLNYRSRFNFFT